MCCLEPWSLLTVSPSECGVQGRPASNSSLFTLSSRSTPLQSVLVILMHVFRLCLYM